MTGVQTCALPIFVSMSKRTGMTVSQVVDEVLYTGLIEMHELDAPGKAPGAHYALPTFT